jgi:tRNA G10  N-methylase Trm11
MHRLVFIPGKNPNLSLAELASWLDSRGSGFRIAETGDGFILAEAEKAPQADDLGGMIKVCRHLGSFDKGFLKEPENMFSRLDGLPSGKKFGLSIYPDSGENNTLSNAMALSLKEIMGGKFMPVPKGRSSLTHVEVIKQKLDEVVVCMGPVKIHVAGTLSVHNPFEFQKRDVQRPSQRPMYSIPPRLAKIMINLSRTKESRNLLDPFCGIGGILQEAAIMGLEPRGIDIDGKCIPQAIRNLMWISKEYRIPIPNPEKKIRQGDATKLSSLFRPESIDLIVTEPNLGPALKISPDRNRAERILRGLRPLYEKSLKEFSLVLKPKGRVCMVFPRFEFGRHFSHLEAEKLAGKAGLKSVNVLEEHGLPGKFPYIDKEERHRTIREIWAFGKA